MANKYLSASLGTRNWNDTTGTWVTTNGGTTPTTAPTTSDIAYMTSLSGNVTCTTASDTAGNLTATGYTGTLTINASCQLTVVANLTLPVTMTLTNNGTFQYMTSSTINAYIIAPLTLSGNWYFYTSGNKIVEIGSNLTFTNELIMEGQGRWNSVGGTRSVYFQNGVSGNGNIMSGDIYVYLQGGKMNFKAATAKVYIDGNITVNNNVGTYVYGGFGFTNNATEVIYLSGSFTNTNTPIPIQGEVTFDTGSDIVFDRLYFVSTVATTYTLKDDLYVRNISAEGTGQVKHTINGAFKIKVSGSILSWTNNTFYSNYFGGTATFEMVGTGTLGVGTNIFGSSSSKATTYLFNNVEVNTSGTMTWGNIGLLSGGTFTYVTGSFTGNGNVYVPGVYNFSGNIIYPNFTVGYIDYGTTGTPGSYANVSNFLTDCTISNLTENYNSLIDITDTKTINVTTSFNSYGNIYLNNIIQSSGTGYINYTGSLVNMNLTHTDFINISGNDLIVFNGSVTTSSGINIVQFKDISSPKITILEI